MFALETANPTIKRWLLIFAGLVGFMVVFGGYVRLTRSGLSIVEWNPISGVIPPLTQQAWEEEFAKYQQTPEFQKVNYNMTLAGVPLHLLDRVDSPPDCPSGGIVLRVALFLVRLPSSDPVEGDWHLHRHGIALCRAGGDGLADGRQRTGG
jgi:hypothetical protein